MSADMGCQLCSDGSAWLGPLIFFVALGALCGAYVYNKERLKAWELRNRKWLTKFGFHFTQFLITTQIIVMLKINHERCASEPHCRRSRAIPAHYPAPLSLSSLPSASPPLPFLSLP